MFATAAEDLQWWGDSWLDNIAYRGLDVEINVPVHMSVMTYDEVIDMVNPGIPARKRTGAGNVKKVVTFLRVVRHFYVNLLVNNF